jgi:hypothetical protein
LIIHRSIDGLRLVDPLAAIGASAPCAISKHETRSRLLFSADASCARRILGRASGRHAEEEEGRGEAAA